MIKVTCSGLPFGTDPGTVCTILDSIRIILSRSLGIADIGEIEVKMLGDLLGEDAGEEIEIRINNFPHHMITPATVVQIPSDLAKAVKQCAATVKKVRVSLYGKSLLDIES